MRGSLLILVALLGAHAVSTGEPVVLELRDRPESPTSPGEFKMRVRQESWNPQQTAVVVCDMWDAHHCLNAVRRVEELAPRMDALLKAMREKGALIVHSPSSCMDFYADHPAREMAKSAPRAANLPEGIDQWLHWIDEREEKAGYPIDHSDGGEDDDPEEHARWAETLKERGLDPRSPWKRQIAALEIDPARDAITDSGSENWNLLQQRGIKNVLMVGVHTNMCVLGRPFGLRQLAKNGINVVLVRDLTDTMYNPAMPPKVSHFAGTDLIIEHIEKYVCPTVTSDQILGGAPFVFAGDKRPKVLFLIGEREYRTAETLPRFAAKQLTPDYRCQFLFAADGENDFGDVAGALPDTDLLFVSVRRRSPPEAQLQAIRKFVSSGKPVVGIRTASHAFSLRGKAPPEGLAVWEKFDPEVFGGNYHGHHGNKLKTSARPIANGHPILEGMDREVFDTGGSLYEVLPLEKGAEVLVQGQAEGIDQSQPVAWTFRRADGGRSFYTSLGHVLDFERAQFIQLLRQGVDWGIGGKRAVQAKGEATIKVPGVWEDQGWQGLDGIAWYIARVRLPADWGDPLKIEIESIDNASEVYVGGRKIGGSGSLPPNFRNGLHERISLAVPDDLATPGADLEVAIRVYDEGGRGGFKGRAPLVVHGDLSVVMAGEWRFVVGGDAPPPAGDLPAFEAVTRTTRSAHETTAGAMSPQASLERMRVPDDLEVDLVLSEPLVAQPLHLSFDARGRLWVAQYRQYPEPAGLKQLSRDKVWRVAYDRMPPPPPHEEGSPFRGKDRISIHEDTDGDGVFDRHKVFADGLNMATSVAHDEGGIWVTNPPYLLFFPDRDGDDVPDGDPEVHLKGFGLEDSHSIANSLTWGPDGWLYGAQGSTVSAAIIRPGLDRQEDAVHSMGQNIWRYHPETRRYEIFAEGGGNAFGVEIDSRARVFSGHNGGDTRGFHYVQGAYYRKSWGKHGALTNPHAYGYFPAMKNAKVARFTHQFIIYEDVALPERYHGKLWGVDVLHNNIVLSELLPDGSTFETRDVERVVQSEDPWFRPVMVAEGPDGAIYIADWYDQQVNHYRNHEGRIDREMGRVYRVRPKGARVGNRSSQWRPERERWGGDIGLAAKVRSRVDRAREDDGELADWLLQLAAGEADLEALAQLACSARRVAPAIGLGVAQRLSRRDELAEDPHLPLLLWWAIESHVDAAPDAVVSLFEDSTFWRRAIPSEVLVPRIMRRFAAEDRADAYRRCAQLLRLAPDEASKRALMAGYGEAVAGRPARDLPAELLAEFRRIDSSLPLSLRLRIGADGAVEESLQQVADASVADSLRAELAAVLGETWPEGSGRVLLEALAGSTSEPVELACIAALARAVESVDVQEALLEKARSTSRPVRAAAIDVLAGHREAATRLLRSAASSEIEIASDDQALSEKLRAHHNPEIDRLMRRLWGEAEPQLAGAAQMEIARVSAVLDGGGGVPKRGEPIFANRCANCHRLFDSGGHIGPDLTSYQRGDQDSLLLSIVQPSAEIREGFEHSIAKLQSGAVHSGFRVDESDESITLRELSGATRTLSRAQIASIQASPISLMPPGLLGGLSDDELRDLFAYLRSTTPPF